MSRAGKINRAGGDYESAEMPEWLSRFADSLKAGESKSAVEVARIRDQEAQDISILNQISNLVSGKSSRHSTVDSVVEEMRERTGLNAYLQRRSSKTAKASDEKDNDVKITIQLPESLSKYESCVEDIVNFIKNTIENMHGQGVTIPQLQHDILHTFGKRHGLEPEDVLNDEVAQYINNAIIASHNNVRDEHNPNIGAGVGRTESEDDDGKDAFSILMPAK
jgi:hypothetical protein